MRSARIDRFKLASRAHVRDRLLEDPGIAAAVARHAAEQGIAEAAAWGHVRAYIREIVPFFNAIAYFHVGYRLAGWLTGRLPVTIRIAYLAKRILSPVARLGRRMAHAPMRMFWAGDRL